MPGILKTVGHNKDHPKPIKVYFKIFRAQFNFSVNFYHVSSVSGTARRIKL